MSRLKRMPEGYTCPVCKTPEALSAIVDGSFFLKYGDFQPHHDNFSEEGKPEDQGVRVCCDQCDKALPITSAMAGRLRKEAEP